MDTATAELFRFDNSFARELPELYVDWQAAPVPAPRLLALNDQLAAEVGLDPDVLRSPDGVAMLAGNIAPTGAAPIAMAYAGHQFGNYSPRLGDGTDAACHSTYISGSSRANELSNRNSSAVTVSIAPGYGVPPNRARPRVMT